MKRLCGFVLAFFCFACKDPQPLSGKWDGTYIGYMHLNRKDTLPLTLVLAEHSFAAAPAQKELQASSNGIFYERESKLVFSSQTAHSAVAINGVYQYDFGFDGSLRIWQDDGKRFSELILLPQ